MSDSLIEKMIAKGVNINNFQEVFNFFHSIDAIETDLLALINPYLVDIAQDIVNKSIEGKADQADVDVALSQKLNRDEYNDHFRGLFKSYISLTEANIVAVDGDYAHIDGGVTFGRMAAIWDSDDQKWVINEVQVALNTDEMPEGALNLYFKQDRVKNTVLTGLTAQNPTEITPTDSIITALAKLQAQLKASKSSEVKWYKAEEIGEIPIGTIIPSVVMDGQVIHLEFANIQGVLWMRGGFTPVSTINADVRILILNPEWKVQALKIGQLINSPIYVNMFNALSPSTENTVYAYSNGIVTSKSFDVEQSIRVRYFVGAGSWVVGNNGCISLGALVNP